jgi:putative transposase
VSEFELMESKPRVTADQVVGGDLGLHTYLTLSDGTEIPPPRFLRQYAKKLRRAQRQMSRRVQGSRNRAQARLQVAKLYERIRHRRSNFSHQLTHGLMRYPALCLENLGLVGLAKTKLAKSMLDAALGETLRQWKYKSVWYNTHAIQAASSFLQPSCAPHVDTRIKTFVFQTVHGKCPACQTQHRRDFNAARNLRDEGIRQLVAMGILETLNACGQHVRPAMVGNAG